MLIRYLFREKSFCPFMSCDGGNDCRQARNGGEKRKRETGSAIDFTVNLVDYDRCVRLCR